MDNLNGIIIAGKVYVLQDWTIKECFGCDLLQQCTKRPIEENPFCSSFTGVRRRTFRFSQSLTDRLNRQ